MRQDEQRTNRMHLAFCALWLLTWGAGSPLYARRWPSVGLVLAVLLPLALGWGVALVWRRTVVGAIALNAGESLSVLLGSTLVGDPGSPLALLLLWPLIRAGRALPPRAGLGLLVGSLFLYANLSLWQGALAGQAGPGLLSTLLYLLTFGGVFTLARWSRPDKGPAAPNPAPAGSPVSSTAAATATSVVPAPPPPSPAGKDPPQPAAPAALSTLNDTALHQDLRVARDIQVSLLLASSPRLPGWETSTSFLPARELGGDLYDFIDLDETHRGIMIGDVAGKGIPAALHMAVTRTLFRMEAQNHLHPADALTQINRSMIEQIPQGCVTMLYGSLEITSGHLILANAGHNYPLLLGERVRELPLNGLPLGIDKDYLYQELTAELAPGEALVFYTDGVVDATNTEGELFGFERLQDLLENGFSRRPRTLARQIVRAVKAFTQGAPQNDDITLVILRRRYQETAQEIAQVARDVLGPERAPELEEQLATIELPQEASKEVWRAALLTLGGWTQDRWGQGAARELLQQWFLTLEGLSE